MTTNQQTTIPEITVGDWTFKGDGGQPALFNHGVVVFNPNSAYLRQAALDLMKLAEAVAAAGY